MDKKENTRCWQCGSSWGFEGDSCLCPALVVVRDRQIAELQRAANDIPGTSSSTASRKRDRDQPGTSRDDEPSVSSSKQRKLDVRQETLSGPERAGTSHGNQSVEHECDWEYCAGPNCSRRNADFLFGRRNGGHEGGHLWGDGSLDYDIFVGNLRPERVRRYSESAETEISELFWNPEPPSIRSDHTFNSSDLPLRRRSTGVGEIESSGVSRIHGLSSSSEGSRILGRAAFNEPDFEEPMDAASVGSDMLRPSPHGWSSTIATSPDSGIEEDIRESYGMDVLQQEILDLLREAAEQEGEEEFVLNENGGLDIRRKEGERETRRHATEHPHFNESFDDPDLLPQCVLCDFVDDHPFLDLHCCFHERCTCNRSVN